MIALYHYHHDIDMNGVVYSYAELYRKTFTPLPCDTLILDRLQGGTYEEKQNQLRGKAILYSYLSSVVNMGWSDLAAIQSYFAKYGKRYGLLREFKENGIL